MTRRRVLTDDQVRQIRAQHVPHVKGYESYSFDRLIPTYNGSAFVHQGNKTIMGACSKLMELAAHFNSLPRSFLGVRARRAGENTSNRVNPCRRTHQSIREVSPKGHDGNAIFNRPCRRLVEEIQTQTERRGTAIHLRKIKRQVSDLANCMGRFQYSHSYAEHLHPSSQHFFLLTPATLRSGQIDGTDEREEGADRAHPRGHIANALRRKLDHLTENESADKKCATEAKVSSGIQEVLIHTPPLNFGGILA
jgi:hypothetical protein